jgi:hypothetical protein
MIRTLAEESLEKFRAEERRRAEELAYKQYRTLRRQLIIGSCSFVALFLVIISAWLLRLQREVPTIPVPGPSVPTAPVAPPVVATVTKASDARWDRPDTPPTPGTELIPGLIRVETGFLEITFNSGARIIIEAPAEMDVVDENMARLNSGVLTAHIPPTAQGFQVETPSVCVTDLGTRFGLVVYKRGITDIHVFKGCVAASFENPQQNERDRIKTLYTNDAMRFDVEANKMEKIQTNQQDFALSWNDVLYRPRTSGPVRFIRTPVSTFSQIRNDNYVTILLECTNRYLPHDIPVDITDSGSYQEFENLSGKMPVGTRVDSYLIHWDPASEAAMNKRMTGTVTFIRPILGLIVQTDWILESHRLFRRPGIIYPDRHGIRNNQGLESVPSANSDAVTLSQDRRTLSFRLRASQTDQIRILVAAASIDEK